MFLDNVKSTMNKCWVRRRGALRDTGMLRSRLPEYGTFPFCDQWHWIDLAVLRQCQSDFKPEKVYDIVAEVGCTYIEVDGAQLKMERDGIEYFKRSFCAFEAYASASSDCKLLCNC